MQKLSFMLLGLWLSLLPVSAWTKSDCEIVASAMLPLWPVVAVLNPSEGADILRSTGMRSKDALFWRQYVAWIDGAFRKQGLDAGQDIAYVARNAFFEAACQEKFPADEWMIDKAVEVAVLNAYPRGRVFKDNGERLLVLVQAARKAPERWLKASRLLDEVLRSKAAIYEHQRQ